MKLFWTKKPATQLSQWSEFSMTFSYFQKSKSLSKREFSCYKGCWNKQDIIFEGGSKDESHVYIRNKSQRAWEVGSAII